MKEILFYFLSGIILFSAFLVIRLKNIFHAALCLIITFIAVAGIYLLLNAEFLALVQVLIYSGAIAILIIFAVMLTKISKVKIAHNDQQLTALLITLSLTLITFFILNHTNWEAGVNLLERGAIYEIGRELMLNYLLPFEVISIVLLAALMGAISLTKKESLNEDKKQEK
ncbi:MAG: NADH-quinone oxidoreductase subunit J [Armatimonadetes bacterium]|nr:NADH-quinone oxidoreductase subunit J [Armatimonadota bacterium]